MAASEHDRRPQPGWFEDPAGGGGTRWWDGIQWTDHTFRPQPNEPSARAERWTAALAHLGVPLCSALLPALIWSSSPPGSFARTHARQAFSFQVTFLAVWVVLVSLQFFGVLSPLVLVATLGGVLLFEFPNVLAALAGRQPVRLIPFEPLPE